MRASSRSRNADPRDTPTRPCSGFSPEPRDCRGPGRGALATQRSAPADWRPDLSAQLFLADADAEVASRYADIANRYLGHDSHHDN